MMAWSASLFNGGGALLSVACMLMMGLLVWLLIRLTATDPNSAPVVVVGRGTEPARTAEQAVIAEVPTTGDAQPAAGDLGRSASVGP